MKHRDSFLLSNSLYEEKAKPRSKATSRKADGLEFQCHLQDKATTAAGKRASKQNQAS
jgi:hypothetical protein